MTTKMIDVQIKASNVRPGTTGAGGWDADIEVTLNGAHLPDGEVTLLPAEYDNRPAAWGCRDNWISGALLAALEERVEDHDLHETLNNIEAAVAHAITRSGVEPAKAYNPFRDE